MFKKYFFFFLAPIFLSCAKNTWRTELKNQIDIYNNTAEKEESYEVETNSLTSISVQKFEERYGLQKIVAWHQYEGFMDFERHLFLKDGEIVYSHYFGTAPKIGQSSSEFLIFNEQTFWQNQEQGVLLKQQIVKDTFLRKKKAFDFLKEAGVTERKATSEDYLKIRKYYEEITSSKSDHDRR